MSSLKNAISRRPYKERAQPHSRKKFGLLEKHKDYIERAQAYHKKEDALQRLKEKAAFRNPDEFNFKMIRTRTIGGVHQLEDQKNKYTEEQLMLMKTQDIGYIVHKIQKEKKKISTLMVTTVLRSLDDQSNKHIYFDEDREKAKEIQLCSSEGRSLESSEMVPDDIGRKTMTVNKELEARRKRVSELEKLYVDMTLQRELKKKGRKHKLRKDELVNPTSKPVYRWLPERKR